MHIFIADRRPKVRYALQILLSQSLTPLTISEFADRETLLSRASAVSPDIVLLSWSLIQEHPDASLLALSQTNPRLAIIVISGRSEMRQAALTAGADAFVSKTDPPEVILETVTAYAEKIKHAKITQRRCCDEDLP